MELDFDTCWPSGGAKPVTPALTGCSLLPSPSTGIYCRPICPAMHAESEQRPLLPLAPAMAQAAGFRACRRCRPDAAPRSPDWNVRADLVGRAMRLIADGVVDSGGSPVSPAGCGYSPRHLHRQLTAEVGAGPLAVARRGAPRRARLLIEPTAMPLAESRSPRASGSIRQFNDSMRAAFGCNPQRTAAPARDDSGRRRRHHAAARAPRVVRRLVSPGLSRPARRPGRRGGFRRDVTRARSRSADRPERSSSSQPGMQFASGWASKDDAIWPRPSSEHATCSTWMLICMQWPRFLVPIHSWLPWSQPVPDCGFRRGSTVGRWRRGRSWGADSH